MSNKDNDTIHLLDLILVIFVLKSPSKTTERIIETTKILDIETEKGKENPSKTNEIMGKLDGVVAKREEEDL